MPWYVYYFPQTLTGLFCYYSINHPGPHGGECVAIRTTEAAAQATVEALNKEDLDG